MTVIEKVAYLRGLADGLKLTDTSAEGKVLLNVIEVLDDLALSVTDLEDAVEELGEVVDAIDDDLQDVEDALYGRSVQIAAGAAFAVTLAIQIIQIELQLFAAVGAVDLAFAQHAFVHADKNDCY